MVGSFVRFLLFTRCEFTRSLRSLVRLTILHNSWIKIVRTHQPWSNLYIWYWQKQTHKQNIKMEFLTIYCFVFLLKMKPWGSFQVNEATNVVFMISGGCFISEIVLNLSFRWVKKILVKSDSMFTLACEQVLHVRVSQSKCWTINFH